jgi:hypothetical protein
MARKIVDTEKYPCGDPRSDENTVTRKNGTKVCRRCSYVTQKEWRDRNRIKVKEINYLSYEKFKDSGRDSWAKRNPERVRDNTRAWREANSERSREINREWYERNKHLVSARNKARRKAAKESQSS